EPDPFCLEVSLPPDALWTLRDVTEDIVTTAEAERTSAVQKKTKVIEAAITALVDLVGARHALGEPLLKEQAMVFLGEDHKISRNVARKLIQDENGRHWIIVPLPEVKGHPHVLLPCVTTPPQADTPPSSEPPVSSPLSQDSAAARIDPQETPIGIRASEEGIL